MTDAGAIKKIYEGNNNSVWFKFLEKITNITGANGTRDVKIMVPLKYLHNFLRALEMPLINLAWSYKCVLSNDNKAATYNSFQL